MKNFSRANSETLFPGGGDAGLQKVEICDWYRTDNEHVISDAIAVKTPVLVTYGIHHHDNPTCGGQRWHPSWQLRCFKLASQSLRKAHYTVLRKHFGTTSEHILLLPPSGSTLYPPWAVPRARVGTLYTSQIRLCVPPSPQSLPPAGLYQRAYARLGTTLKPTRA